jgi:uncharacterized protein (TIGR01319 family)
VDFGSTFTKLLLVDPQAGAILARAYRPTTVGEGVEVGLRAGLADLALDAGPGGAELVRRASPRLACSSAAGGLRMVAVGLVRELTAAAATAAALGAGARLLRTYSHRLTPDEVAGIGAARPDVLLLAGGTDGGDRQTLLHNAAALAVLPQGAAGPLVVAGNKEVTGDAVATLRRAGHDARPAPNVLPSLGRLEVAPAQEAIRQVFLERIVHRKGLDGALAHLDGIVLPTPAAVLNAAALLRESPAWPQGLLGEAWPQGLLEDGPHGDGDLVIVDVGGATTDVHSAGDGTPSRPEVYLQGLPEPRLKRTVEGDLGLRVSAPSTWEAISGRWGPAVAGAGGEAGSLGRVGSVGSADDVRARLEAYAAHPGLLSAEPGHLTLDAHLAAGAVALALERHAGTLEELVTPAGRFWVQRGKDLSGVALVIGSGGIFRSSAAGPGAFRAGVRAGAADPLRLAPRAPFLALDRDYVLWAAGLLAPTHPEGARRLIRRSLHGCRPS